MSCSFVVRVKLSFSILKLIVESNSFSFKEDEVTSCLIYMLSFGTIKLGLITMKFNLSYDGNSF